MKIFCALVFVVFSLWGNACWAGDAASAPVNFGDGVGNGSPDEQDAGYERYVQSYFARYHALGSEAVPELKDFRDEVDAQGRPKWFDGATGDYTLKMLVIRLFVKEQFDDLERLIADWNNPENRAANGKWKLASYPDALAMRFSSGTWEADYQIITHWRQTYPQSAAAAIAEATYWENYAWNARGSGFADSVSQEGWKLFGERIHKSEAVLLNSESYASGNPEWYARYLSLAKALDWPKASLLRLSDEALQKQRTYYPTYYAVIRALTPSWGGDWVSVDSFIKDSAAKAKDKEGAALYARLYMSASGCGTCNQKFNLFHDTLASWPEMKKGFDDLLRQYPHSAWNLNKYASFACQAGDKATFQAVRFRMGKNVIPDAWRSNYSLDLCEHQFPDQPL